MLSRFFPSHLTALKQLLLPPRSSLYPTHIPLSPLTKLARHSNALSSVIAVSISVVQPRFYLRTIAVVDMMNFAAVPSTILLHLVAFQNLYIFLAFM